MSERAPFLQSLFQGSDLTGGSLILTVVILLISAAWSICFVGAFYQVKRTPVTSVLFAMVFGGLTSFLLAMSVWTHFPDLANEFTPVGLWFFSFLLTTLVFSVPLLQWLWKVHYMKSLACLMTGLAFLVVMFVAIQMSMQPVKSMPARPSLPMFLNLD